jgi:hypothetical protein
MMASLPFATTKLLTIQAINRNRLRHSHDHTPTCFAQQDSSRPSRAARPSSNIACNPPTNPQRHQRRRRRPRVTRTYVYCSSPPLATTVANARQRDFYKYRSRPVFKAALIAIFTYEILYWGWLKLESIETKHDLEGTQEHT